MELITNIDIYPKIIIGLTGLIAAIIKFRDSFSAIKRKQELKLDLELLELMLKNNVLDTSEIQDRIKTNISKSFDERNDILINFLVGIVVFVGFGLWTIDIFQTNERFNGWVILTTACSIVGLSLLVSPDSTNDSKDVFYKIGLFDKKNFQIGFIITLISAAIITMLILKSDGFSFWQFLAGLFLILGFTSITKNIKRIN